MDLHAHIPRVALQVSQGVVVASIQFDLDDDTLAQFQSDLLDCIHRTGSRAVVLDASGLETLDAEEFAALRRVIAMASLLGAEVVLVGLRPGIVSALVDTGADVDGLRAAINLDAAFALLRTEAGGEEEADPEEDASPEAEAEPEPEREG